MSDVWELVAKGGPVMLAIIGVSVFLYERCITLLLTLRRARRRLDRRDLVAKGDLVLVRSAQADLPEHFAQQRLVIRSLVAAAPLLGLLGTVTGMITTFESIATRSGERSMAGLAEGISQALVTTETGLAVVIPAVLLLYFAQRQLQKTIQKLILLERRLSAPE